MLTSSQLKNLGGRGRRDVYNAVHAKGKDARPPAADLHPVFALTGILLKQRSGTQTGGGARALGGGGVSSPSSPFFI